MRNKFILSLALSVSMGAYAEDRFTVLDTAKVVQIEDGANLFRSVEPSYLEGALVTSPWSGHWFIQVAGGTTAFLGKPLGCNDLFGRMEPAFHVAVGKWFTPSVGGRLDYGGIQINDCLDNRQKYQYLRADLMWNVLGGRFKNDDQTYHRWNVIPYAGVGMLHNKDNGNKPFAISLGLLVQYHLNRRLAVMAEVGDMLTMQDFDGYGKAYHFGDNLLSASLGLSVTFGKTAWKRAVDVRPYMMQNDFLYDYATSVREHNDRLRSQHEQDLLAREQLRKILAIEGLLDNYANLFENDAASYTDDGYPKNDYSGLNSLRARMKNRGNATADSKQIGTNKCPETSGTEKDVSSDDYFTLVQSGEICLGAPVYFFFNVGTANLVNVSQLTNLEEVARIAKKYGLSVRVVGAADSATGTTAINDNLSKLRAEFIVNELVKYGMESGTISQSYDGGIDDYSPKEANRHTRIMLYYN